MASDRGSRLETKPLRLFLAVEVPPEAKGAVAEAVTPWREAFPKARWAPKENWHVTLKFLGSTYPRLVGWVHQQVASAAAGIQPFETRLTGLGAFPSPGRARVLWAGLDDRSGRMAQLARALDASLANEFTTETRAFTGHLTVARSDPPMRLPTRFSETPMESVEFMFDHITLFRSHLQRPAPRYEPLQVFPLGDSGPVRGPAPAR